MTKITRYSMRVIFYLRHSSGQRPLNDVCLRQMMSLTLMMFVLRTNDVLASPKLREGSALTRLFKAQGTRYKAQGARVARREERKEKREEWRAGHPHPISGQGDGSSVLSCKTEEPSPCPLNYLLRKYGEPDTRLFK